MMESIIARKYAVIEKLMHFSEDELAALEAAIDQFYREESVSNEQYNRELEEADAEIERGEFYTHEHALERLNAWKKKED